MLQSWLNVSIRYDWFPFVVELTDGKADVANRPAAETLFEFSQNFGLGNLFQFVVQGWLEHANVENAFAQCYRCRVRSDKFTDDFSPRVHHFRLMQTLA